MAGVAGNVLQVSFRAGGTAADQENRRNTGQVCGRVFVKVVWVGAVGP